MGVLTITEFIGEQIKTANPYLSEFAVNCIKIDGAKVVNFIGAEKENFVPTDIKGNSGYLRLDPNIQYKDAKISSCVNNKTATIKFRVVIFSINQSKRLHPVKTEAKINVDLSSMSFGAYTGKETDIKLLVNSSNLYDHDNMKQEVGEFDIPAESVVIGLNCTLSFDFNPKCATVVCDVFENVEC